MPEWLLILGGVVGVSSGVVTLFGLLLKGRDAKIQALEARCEEFEKAISKIERDIAVIETNRGHGDRGLSSVRVDVERIESVLAEHSQLLTQQSDILNQQSDILRRIQENTMTILRHSTPSEGMLSPAVPRPVVPPPARAPGVRPRLPSQGGG